MTWPAVWHGQQGRLQVNEAWSGVTDASPHLLTPEPRVFRTSVLPLVVTFNRASPACTCVDGKTVLILCGVESTAFPFSSKEA